MSLWKKFVKNIKDDANMPPQKSFLPRTEMETIAAEVGEEQFAKWFDDFLQQDLGFNELDSSEISTKVMKNIKVHYIPVLQKAVEAHHRNTFMGDS